MPLQHGHILKDRYEIDCLLGQGGMGAVYRALDTLPSNPIPVALKERSLEGLPTEPGPNTPEETRMHGASPVSVYTRRRAAEQFKTEARLLYDFRHTNLPKVSDYFADGDCLYLVMELIEGRNLDQILEANGDRPLPEADVLNWLGQVMDALAYCHSHNIFHRDIKPANIILNPQGKAYLVDFGIARFSTEGRATTILGGTPGFRPLEQISPRGKVDARSDIYALGATLYLLLIGRVPEDVLDRALMDELIPPRQINPGISAHVEAAILQAMQMKPEARFPDVEEMAGALQKSIPLAVLPDQPAPKLIISTSSVSKKPKNSQIVNNPKIPVIDLYEGSNLSMEILSAPPGATLRLHAGNYLVNAPIKIEKDLSIIAIDGEYPQIISKTPVAVAVLRNAKWFLNGLCFVYSDFKPADILYVVGGHIEINNCVFSGGCTDFAHSTGNGLYLDGSTYCKVEQCEFSNNGLNGIYANNAENLVLINNKFENNQNVGIYCSGESDGIVDGNICQNNLDAGILIRGSSSLHLKNNQCISNVFAGIALFDNAFGTIESNECRDNNGSGIIVSNRAYPSVINNVCEGNKKAGISYFKNSSGKAEKNQCLRNKLYGIAVVEFASPTILDNSCNGNLLYGLYIENEAGPNIGSNDLKNNKIGPTNF